MTNVVSAQPARVPLGSVTISPADLQRIQQGAISFDVFIRREWFRFLDQVAVNNGTVTNEEGDLIADQLVVGNSGADVKTLPAGANGYVATMVGGIAAWAPAGGGGSLTITELDGVPSVAATSLVLPNGTLSVLGTVATYTPAASASTFPKGAAWDGGGTLSAVIAGSTNVIFPPRAQAAGTILGAYAIASGVGSCTVEVWKSAAGTVPTAANKISASAPITLASAQSSVDTTLTGWTTAVALGDQFAFKLLTCAALTWAEVYVLIG